MKCQYCGQEQTTEEMQKNAEGVPCICFMCGKEIIKPKSRKIINTSESPNFDLTLLYRRLSEHCGHDVAIVKYGIGHGCYCLECNDCNEVICDTDIYDLCGKE